MAMEAFRGKWSFQKVVQGGGVYLWKFGVDRVFNNKSLEPGPWDRGLAVRLSPWWTKGDADMRHGDASLVRGMRALRVTDACRHWLGRMGKARQSQRGAHRARAVTEKWHDDGGELLIARVLESGRELESKGRGAVVAGGGAHFI
jgi:hypothetical protein